MSKPDDNAYFLQEVQLDEEDDLEYKEVDDLDESDDDSSDDDNEDFSSVMQSVKAAAGDTSVSLPPIHDKGARSPERKKKEKTVVKERPIVVDDFIRNFFIKLNMQKSLDAFQTEWYEMKREGKLNPEDMEIVSDIYRKNESLDDQVKQLRAEVKRSKAVADKAKGTWDKFRKERDFHRMHHRRVVQEKNDLIRDMKRLKRHFSTYEPALKKMRNKYEVAMKEKMLMRLEKDRMKTKVEALEKQIQLMEQASLGDTARTASPDASDRKREDKKTGHGGGGERKQRRKKKKKDSPWPAEDRINPYADVSYDPVDCENFQLRKTFKGHRMAISGMALHPKKPIIATVSDDMTWKMWSIPRGDLIMSGDGHKDWIAACDFHPRGTLLATASGDGTVKLWDFTKAICAQTLTDHTHAVWDCSFHDSGDFLLTASMDFTGKLWDINTGKCRQTFRTHNDSVNCITSQPYSNMVVTASGDNTVNLWDMRSGLCIQVISHSNAAIHAAFNVKGDTIVSSDADGIVKLFDVRAAALRMEIATCGPEERMPVNEARFDQSGQVIGVASDSGVVQFYNAENGDLLQQLEGHEDAIQSLLFDPNGQYVISGASDCSFRLWSA